MTEPAPVIVEFERAKIDELADIIERLAIGRSPENSVDRDGRLWALYDEHRPSTPQPSAQGFLIWLPGFLRGVANFYEHRQRIADWTKAH